MAIETHGRCTDSGVIFPLKWHEFYPDVIICEGLSACGTIFVCLFICDLFVWSWVCTWNIVCSIQSLSMYFFAFLIVCLCSGCGPALQGSGIIQVSSMRQDYLPLTGEGIGVTALCTAQGRQTLLAHSTPSSHHCTQIYRWAANYVYLCILCSHLCISTHRLSGKTDPLNNTSKVNIQSLMECWNFPQKRDFCF